MLSPVEFIKLVILCLLDANFCLNLQHCTEILATVKRHGAYFYWQEKSIWRPLCLFSIPHYFLLFLFCGWDCSWNAASAVFFSDSWNYSEITAMCNKSLWYWKLSSSCSWQKGFYHPDTRDLWHWTSRYGHTGLSRFLCSFQLVDIFLSRWSALFMGNTASMAMRSAVSWNCSLFLNNEMCHEKFREVQQVPTAMGQQSFWCLKF